MKKNLHKLGKFCYVDDGTIYASRKTTVWQVYAEDGETHLGTVQWFGRWRKYVFQPPSGCVFEQVCLRALADFCEAQTTKHYAHCKMLKSKQNEAR